MTYAGNRLLNTNNSSAIFFLGFGVFLFLNGSHHNTYLPYYFFAIGFFLTSAEAFYFEITPDKLIVKNYMIPFFKIGYQLNEITGVRFMGTSYRSNSKACVRIVRGDKQSFRFSAASLRINDWQLFVNELSSKKIPVNLEASTLKSKIGIPED